MKGKPLRRDVSPVFYYFLNTIVLSMQSNFQVPKSVIDGRWQLWRKAKNLTYQTTYPSTAPWHCHPSQIGHIGFLKNSHRYPPCCHHGRYLTTLVPNKTIFKQVSFKPEGVPPFWCIVHSLTLFFTQEAVSWT